MQTNKRLDDVGSLEKMSPFQRINTEFGGWDTSGGSNERTAAAYFDYGKIIQAPSAGTPSCKPCRAFNAAMHGTPRYSKIDKFIENLDAACDALPVPLMGSARAPPQRTAKNCRAKQHRDANYRKLQKARRPPSHEIVKEVKFAEEVVEIGQPEEMVSEAPEVRCWKRSVGDSAELAVAADQGAGESREAAEVERPLIVDRQESNKRNSRFAKAATKVQSTYRGYKVRRGQPLRYLLVISGVKAKLDEMKQHFDAWKIASWFPTDVLERGAMLEGVTKLLMQLDALQGLPGSVREYRKSVAREVAKFQGEVEGFLCKGTKHGSLPDPTKHKCNAAARKSSVAIRQRAFHEPGVVESVKDSKRNAYRTIGNLGSWKGQVEGETTASSDADTDEDSDGGSTSEVNDPQSHPDDCLGQGFGLWSTKDAPFERDNGRQELGGENRRESITELKKCIQSLSNFDVCQAPRRKDKSRGVRFHDGSCRVDGVAVDPRHLEHKQEGRNRQEETTAKNRDTDEVKSRDFTGSREQKDDAKCAVSINKQRCLDSFANVRFPKHVRIANLHEDLDESCDARSADSFSVLDCTLVENRKTEHGISFDVICDDRIDGQRRCRTMEQQSSALKLEPISFRDGDLHNPAVAAYHNRPETQFRGFRAKSSTLLTDVECIPSKDFGEGPGEQKAAEINRPASAGALQKVTDDRLLPCARGAPPETRENDRIDKAEGISPDLNSSEIGPRCAEGSGEEQPGRLGTSGSRYLLESASTDFQGSSKLGPSRSVPKISVPQREPEQDCELTTCDDVETVSSCSNCASYRAAIIEADPVGVSLVLESSGRQEIVNHDQTYALKRLASDPGECPSEAKAENSRLFQAVSRKASFGSTTQPSLLDSAVSELNLASGRKPEVEIESWKNLGLRVLIRDAQSPRVDASLPSSASPFEAATNTTLDGKDCSESRQSSPASTMQSLSEEFATSDERALVVRRDSSNVLMAKLVEDNRRLKKLLKQVMQWNTIQASAMVTLNQRLEVVESKK